MNSHVFLGGLAALIQAALAAIVLVKNHRRKENKIFSVLLLLFVITSAGEAYAAYGGINQLAVKLIFIPAVLLFYVFCYFTAIFPTRQPNSPIIKSKLHPALFALPGLYLIYLILTNNFFAACDPINEGFIIAFGKNEFVIKGIIIGYLLLTLTNLTKSQAEEQSIIQGRRLRYTFVAMLLPIAAGSITIALSKFFIGGQTVYLFSLFPVLGIIMSLILTYTMLKYNLMGIDLIFSIGLVYTLTTIVLAGCMELIQEIMEDVFDASDGWEQAVTVLVVAAVFSPIKDTLTWLIDKIFGKKDINSLKTMQKILDNLRQQSSLQNLFDTMKTEIIRAFDIENLEILTYPEHKEKLLSNFPKNKNDIDEIIFHYNNENDAINEELALAFRENGIKLYFMFATDQDKQWHLLLRSKTTKVPYTQEEIDILLGLIKEIPHIMEGLAMLERVVSQEKTAQEIKIASELLKAIAHRPGAKEFKRYVAESFVHLSHGIKGDMIEICQEGGYMALYDAFHSGVKAVTTLNIMYSVLNTAGGAFERLNEGNGILRKFENQELSCALTLLNLEGASMGQEGAGELVLYNYGNPAPIIIKKDEIEIPLIGQGKPLGLMPKLEENSASLKLAEGSLLLLATNGLHKVFENILKRPLEEFLQKEPFESAKDCRDRLAKLVTEAITDDFNDDITFIVVGLK